jgi:hypothetical protein
MLLELSLSALGCAALCYTLGRHSRTATLERWHFLLGLPARQAVSTLRQQMSLDAALARQALDAAARAREAGRLADAVGVLRAALDILEEAGADRRTRLRAMNVYSRMVRAVQPLPTPSGAPFRTRPMRLLGSLAGLAHRLLVGSAERFRLWLLMLGLGVRVVLQGARDSARAASAAPRTPQPWSRFAEGLSDFETLDGQHLAAFEALSASLAAIETERRVRVWDSLI